MAENEDKAQDAQDWKPVIEGLVKAIQMIAEKVDALDGGHSALEKLVVDDLIGGIHGMYKTNMRNGKIESLKSKYGGDLQGHFDSLKDFTPEGTDHWGSLHDMIDGMDDDAADGHIKGLAAGLGEKFGKLRGGPTAVVKAEGGEPKELPPEESAKAAEAAGTLAEVAEKAEPEPKKKTKDELIAEKMKNEKGFKLR
jgi:hypothetical protein